MAAITSFRDLVVWQRGMDLVVECYRLSHDFPPAERFGLSSQIRRAAVSVPANIAEGYGRESTGAYVAHLKIAQGSLKEVETYLVLAPRLRIASDEQVNLALSQCDEIRRMLNSLMRRVSEG